MPLFIIYLPNSSDHVLPGRNCGVWVGNPRVLYDSLQANRKSLRLFYSPYLHPKQLRRHKAALGHVVGNISLNDEHRFGTSILNVGNTTIMLAQLWDKYPECRQHYYHASTTALRLAQFGARGSFVTVAELCRRFPLWENSLPRDTRYP
jgi:hypothetical protein